MTLKFERISKSAQSALITAGTNRQGAKVTASPTVLQELMVAGLIGPGLGLTRAGTIERERLINAALAAFDL